MTEDEIYEDLEVTFGKAPQSVEEKNMAWLLKALDEHANEDGASRMFQSQALMPWQ